MRDRARQVRCAIYTRKSSEEGLEQDFNSLHAQREACEAYIVSQKHEGWRVIPTAYDDGGFSGGSMERPGLQKLLADIASGLIDVVVVYKVDRLTRSLTDFARIVEVFDRQGTSFVSVTQSFNTTSSMGRLTLNVLLSFAQFEREVTGERIRDKIAASKQKGLWMGGSVPLGYDAAGRTLIVNEAEAETVRTIYRLYLELKAVDAVREELERRGLRTKMRPGKSEHMKGGAKFSRGHLYRILANPLYTGRIAHKGKLYEGQHQAIIDLGTWDEVQATLAANSHHQLVKSRSKNPNLLTGLLFDAEGAPFLSTHAVKQGRRYRYYVSGSRQKERRPEGGQASGSKRQGWRLPAAEVEGVIIRFLTSLLTDRAWLLETIGSADQSLQEQQTLMRRGEELSQQLTSLDPVIKRSVVLGLVERIVLAEDLIEIQLRPTILQGHAGYQLAEEEKLKSSGLVTVTRSVSLRRRSVETRLVIEGQGPPEPEPDPALIKALAQAHHWWDDLIHQRYSTMREIAAAYDTDERYVARVISLMFLPGQIKEQILEGRQPDQLTLHSLLNDKNYKELCF